jgi:hypothetical protein
VVPSSDGVSNKYSDVVPDFVRKSYEHEGMAWPYMKVTVIEKKDGVPIAILACRHLQFDVLMWDVFLMIVHPIGTHAVIKCR